MGIINLLSPETIHKIAAGEVIERPANAVKELLENALDAGATKITIALEEGGLDLIRVSDNGKGMLREDAQLAWLPHTTSKIRAADDLQYVATYGFRGEALCSMAAVAELTLETRHAAEPTGIAITVSDSRETGSREVPRNPGTTVSVRNLFLHNPARRKFMGSAKNETARILSVVSRASLAHPAVAFKILDKGREILAYTEGSLKHRVGEVLGFNIAAELVPVEWSDGMQGGRGAIHVEGYVCAPQQARLRSTHQFFFINRRPITSGLASRALAEAYDVLPPGRFPLAVLFLTMTPEEVDVNVHPTKKEVRFLNEGRIYWAISQAVKVALRKIAGIPMLDLGDPMAAPAGSDTEITSTEASAAPLELAPEFGTGRGPGLAPPFAFASRPPARGEGEDGGVPGPASGSAGSAGSSDAASAGKVTDTLLGRGTAPDARNQIRLFPNAPEAPAGPVSRFFPGDESVPAARSRPSEIPFLQLHNGFILFGVESGLMIVNQQAAHERVLYEKALEEMRQTGRFSSQQLLFPEVLELPSPDSAFLEGHLDRLQALGFDLESFGGNAFQLRGLPMEVKPDQGRRVIHELLDGLLRPERGASAPKGEEFQQRLARVYARVASVKLGDPLEYPQVAALIDSLFATQNPYVSPSGAPVVVRFSLDEIQRKFGLKT
ncbi:MAG: DNA mismatch repair endonuclease MutL [Fibrobacteres bacterium]|nr:DNA mismatch repair endonuclease MutL [Fibrobacterota bacterium]